MGALALTVCHAERKRLFVAVSVALCSLALAAFQRAGADPPNPVAKAALPSITIQASREREAVRRRVDEFVAAVIVRPSNETLMRWDTPICPLVAGLPKAWGEFILGHISQAAVDARAPLAGAKCRPNLYVVASAVPEQLLKAWWKREPWMYDRRHGIGPVMSFIESKRPVRSWYNSELDCEDGGPASPGASALSIPSAQIPPGVGAPGAPTCTDGIDTHLSYADARSISSALVVIDLPRLQKMTVQQLADYVALVGLADVRLDADPGTAPSILRLFSGHATAPPGLTPWDQALLFSLYNTRQADKQQMQDMVSTMVSRIAP